MTINGSGFTGTTDVAFHGTSVGSGNFTVVSDAQITGDRARGGDHRADLATTPAVPPRARRTSR